MADSCAGCQPCASCGHHVPRSRQPALCTGCAGAEALDGAPTPAVPGGYGTVTPVTHPPAEELTTMSRFWTLHPDPAVPEHPTSLGTGWVGIVDEEAGGVVAWAHQDTAPAVISGLQAAAEPGQ